MGGNRGGSERGAIVNHIIHSNGKVFERSKFACPCCGAGLFIEMTGKASGEQNPITVFCGSGRCVSQLMNDGITGSDVEDCQDKLKSLLDTEPNDLYEKAGGWWYQRNKK